MPRPAQVLTVVIVSPGDVPRQRDIIQRGVEDWNRGRLGKYMGVRLEAARWELDAVPELGLGDGQEVITRQLLESADILVAIFHSRLGTPTARAASGSAEEVEDAAARGLPVHVYVDGRDIPRDHEPDQLNRLKEYLERLRSRGLLKDISSDDDLSRHVRLALDKDVAGFLQRSTALEATAPAPTGVRPALAWRDQIERATDVVLDLPELAAGQQLDGSPDWIEPTFVSRRAAILAALEPLLRLVITSVREGDAGVNALWLERIPTLAQNPHASGSTRLIELRRAPGALLFHMGGLAACAAGNDLLTGRLLSPLVRVDDPRRGPRAAVVSLRADLAFADQWPSKQLRAFLIPLLAEVVGQRTAERAWERWSYLCAVAITYFSAVEEGVWLDHPYLLVSGHHMTALAVMAAEPVRASILELGASHPLLTAGLCESSDELFAEAAATFESNYGEWGRQRDSDALPPGGGGLPSQPHYPGERDGSN